MGGLEGSTVRDEPLSSVLVVRDDGVVNVPGAIPIVHGLVEAVELLFNTLGIPTREKPEPRTEET